MLHYAASNLVLHSLPMSHKEDTWLKWVKMILNICAFYRHFSVILWMGGKHNNTSVAHSQKILIEINPSTFNKLILYLTINNFSVTGRPGLNQY